MSVLVECWSGQNKTYVINVGKKYCKNYGNFRKYIRTLLHKHKRTNKLIRTDSLFYYTYIVVLLINTHTFIKMFVHNG